MKTTIDLSEQLTLDANIWIAAYDRLPTPNAFYGTRNWLFCERQHYLHRARGMTPSDWLKANP